MGEPDRSAATLSEKEPDPYRELFERSADAILIIDDGAFVDCNQATVEMLRYPDKAQILQSHPSVLSPPRQPDGRDSFAKANEMIATALAQGSHRFEWEHRRADGEIFPVEVLLTAMPPRGDRPVLHCVWRDITARRKLEEHLRLTQKMEAIGRMAGGIAHDFNNLLVPMLVSAELLARQLKEQPKLLRYVDEISGAAERAATLVRQLLSFSRQDVSKPDVVDLGAAVRDLEKLLPRLTAANHELVVRICAEPVRVLIQPGQVEQIVMNLVTNARDAMPDGGVLTIEVRRLEISESTVGLPAEHLQPGAYAVIAVSDTGEGMTPEVVRRAFEPFFTTKEPSKGTGLGLATVYGIARHSGGSAEIQSTLGHGTTHKVYLPLTSATPTRVDADPARELAGNETVLVVEDEARVAKLVVTVLREHGYHVLQARDGVEALEVWRSCDVPIDLVLTDVVMPRMGGIELARGLLAAGYRGRLLLSSGYSGTSLEDAADLGPLRDDLLEKPYTVTELLVRVRQTLAHR
jgi:PAS domain S-box-containing protein